MPTSKGHSPVSMIEPRKAGTRRTCPTPKEVYTKANRKPWIVPCGLQDEFNALGADILRVWYNGSREAFYTHHRMRTNEFHEYCYNAWIRDYPYAFERYKALKGVELTGSNIADRFYNLGHA